MLNALFLDPNGSGGVDTYLRGLAPALRRRAPGTALSIATTRRGAAALRADGWDDWAEVVEFPCDEGDRISRQWAEQVLLPREARRRRCGLVHSLASIGPMWTPRLRHVVTLHDVTFFREPTFGLVTTHGMRTVMRGAAYDADAGLAVTAVARDDIADVLGLDPAALLVAHHGMDAPAPVDAADAQDLRERLDLGTGQVLLCVAAKRPHKNQELLIRALRHLPTDVRLVLVGHPEGYDRELRALADAERVADRVRFVDYAPAPELEALWSIASCAAFPTKAEGFGMPVVEAMRRGVPVACSDLPVLREVGGAVPRFFPPTDPERCAVAIRDTLGGEDRRAAGRDWADSFTWDASADVHLEAYGRAMARPPTAERAGLLRKGLRAAA
jgi:glycosyltransferase involved in cell wall biosynthesis